MRAIQRPQQLGHFRIDKHARLRWVCVPVYPWEHEHTPDAMQTPFLHPCGHRGAAAATEQSAPVYMLEHWHVLDPLHWPLFLQKPGRQRDLEQSVA